MLLVAYRGVMARRLRLLLTSVAVVLAVGFVSGAFLLTDSLRASFQTLFTEAASGIDTNVQTVEYKELVRRQANAGPAAVPIDLSRVGVPPEALDAVREVPGVAKAVGSVFEFGAQPLDRHGRPLGGGGAPVFGASWAPEAEDIGALRLVEGTAPGPREVLLDASLMKAGEFEVGDDVRVLVQGGRRDETFRISGVVKFGTSNDLNGASITVFETRTAQRLFDMGDRFTSVDAKAEPGVSQRTLTRRIDQALPDRYDVVSGAELTRQQTEAIDSAFLDILQNVILGFAAVAVFVGAFTIFNTFTILVGQRTREYGLLRAIGAGRPQVLGIVTLEALVVGVVASTIGLLAGFGIAHLLRLMINSAGPGGFPEGEFALRGRTIAWSYAVGVLVTLVASLVPAWRASRLSPLEALRNNPAHAGRGWKAPAAGAVLLVVGAALVASGFASDGDTVSSVMTRIGGGFAVAILGISLLSRLFIVPVTRVLAAGVARGTAGGLAARNVTRNRARSATTASALMIGLALATLVIVFHGSLQATVDDQIDRALGADILVYNTTALTSGVGVIEESSLAAVRQTPGVAQASGQRLGGVALGRRFGSDADLKAIVAFDSGALGQDGLVRLDLDDGVADPGHGVLVDVDVAREAGVEVGDPVELAFPNGRTRRLEVAGTFEPNEIVGAPFIVSIETFDANEPAQLRAPASILVRVDDGEDPSMVSKAIRARLGDAASYLEIQDTEALRDTFRSQLQPVLGLVLGMLSLSLVIALFGIGNTLALNVLERTREIGLLRAVGATRRQMRRIIRAEAVLVAVFGALLGVLVGLLAGRALIHALADDGFVFAASWPALAAVVAGGFAAGVLASILPARRAARTDVLRAIATE